MECHMNLVYLVLIVYSLSPAYVKRVKVLMGRAVAISKRHLVGNWIASGMPLDISVSCF